MTDVVKKTSSKKLQGEVVKFSSDKSVKVRVETKKRHPLYGKIVKSHKNYLVHNDPENGVGIADIHLGDVVAIEEFKPISKKKLFVLVNKIIKK